MKINRSYYGICAILGIVLLHSCSKDDDKGTKPPAERILGIWNLVKEREILYDENTHTYTDTVYDVSVNPGVFILDFRNDGKIYATNKYSNPTIYDTLTYQVQSEQLLVIDGDNYGIETFTNTQLNTTDYYFDGTDSVKHLLDFKR